jgi:thiamine biosynthesis protein ThiS
MKILINNREEIIDRDSLSVSEMIEMKKYSYRLKIIKVNNTLILQKDYDSTIIRDGDVVQMLYLMSGG